VVFFSSFPSLGYHLLLLEAEVAASVLPPPSVAATPKAHKAQALSLSKQSPMDTTPKQTPKDSPNPGRSPSQKNALVKALLQQQISQ
jgi:hypothetical protein